MGRNGARVAKSVFDGWATLFSHGPTRINLKGPYEISPSGKARHMRLNLQRRAIVTRLQSLASNCDKVRGLAGDIFLWHEGI